MCVYICFYEINNHIIVLYNFLILYIINVCLYIYYIDRYILFKYFKNYALVRVKLM